MGASRDKGNRHERAMATAFQLVDGRDPMYEHMESESGRLGQVYRLQTDFVTVRLAAECKNHEALPARLWNWLDGIGIQDKIKVLILKRNLRRPLVVLDYHDFLTLLREARGERPD